jgi:mannose-6-phosphate isomerase-like protein (cupin superfamily)
MNNSALQVVAVSLDEAAHRSLPEGEYYHFITRGVPVMTLVAVRPGARTGTHVHEKEEQTYYIIKGEGQLLVSEEVIPVSAGTAVLIPPGQPHAIRNTGSSDLEYVMQYLWPGEAAKPIYADPDYGERLWKASPRAH